MPPKKKKAAGNAAAGERVFKNLCGACHALSVSHLNIGRAGMTQFYLNSLTLWAQLSEVCQARISRRAKASPTRVPYPQRLLSSGPTVILISGSRVRQASRQVTLWPSPALLTPKTELTSSPTSRVVEEERKRACEKSTLDKDVESRENKNQIEARDGWSTIKVTYSKYLSTRGTALSNRHSLCPSHGNSTRGVPERCTRILFKEDLSNFYDSPKVAHLSSLTFDLCSALSSATRS